MRDGYRRDFVCGRHRAWLCALLLGAAVFQALPVLAAGQDAGFAMVAAGRLDSPKLDEVSGMAASSHGADQVWMINDSGAGADVFLVAGDGRVRAGFSIEGAANTDWEDLAAFTWRGKRHLLVADTGDNASLRKSCKLHVVREPDADAVRNGGGRLRPEWSLEFRYEDGPRDCEAVAVDAKQEKVLLLSKRTDPPMLYELPLRPDRGGLLTARKTGWTRVDPPAGSSHPYGRQPTAMDLSPDGSMAAVLTYVGVFLFARRSGEDWAAAFARPPRVLSPHGLKQAEALCFSNQGNSIIVTSEGANAPMVRYGK